MLSVVCRPLQTADSVTRFGEISPLWPNVKTLWPFESVDLVFGKILSLFRQICYAFGQIFIVVNSHMLKNILLIWSH